MPQIPSELLRKIEWTNYGQTALGGLGIVAGLLQFYGAPVTLPLDFVAPLLGIQGIDLSGNPHNTGMTLIGAGIMAMISGLLNKIRKAAKK
jgi:hypothetical protein